MRQRTLQKLISEKKKEVEWNGLKAIVYEDNKIYDYVVTIFFGITSIIGFGSIILETKGNLEQILMFGVILVLFVLKLLYLN